MNGIDLLLSAEMLGLNDFNNLVYLNSFEKNQNVSSCLEHMTAYWRDKQKNKSNQVSSLKDKLYFPYTEKSPCFNQTKHQPCKAFCQWNDEMNKVLTKERILALMRYAFPQRKMVVEHDQAIEMDMAKELFGSKGVKTNMTNGYSPLPFSIFCEDEKDKGFEGDSLPSFTTKFCNQFYPTPTDVGFCMTKNIDMESLIKPLDGYYTFMEVDKQSLDTSTFVGTYNAESTDVLMTNVFDGLAHISFADVRMFFNIKKRFMNHVSIFL